MPCRDNDSPSFRMRSAREILLGSPDSKVAALRSKTGVAAGSSATCATLGSGRPTVSAKRPFVYSAGLGGISGCDAAPGLLLVLTLLPLVDAPVWPALLLLLLLLLPIEPAKARKEAAYTRHIKGRETHVMRHA